MVQQSAQRPERSEDRIMSWEAPTFAEIRMDAEIGSYQDDFDPARDEPAFVTSSPGKADEARELHAAG
jgi:hypothetical protein